MGSATSGNRSKLINYSTQERTCTKCLETKAFSQFFWDNRRDCPRSRCIDCIRLQANKAYHIKTTGQKMS